MLPDVPPANLATSCIIKDAMLSVLMAATNLPRGLALIVCLLALLAHRQVTSISSFSFHPSIMFLFCGLKRAA